MPYIAHMTYFRHKENNKNYMVPMLQACAACIMFFWIVLLIVVQHFGEQLISHSKACKHMPCILTYHVCVRVNALKVFAVILRRKNIM